MSRSNPSERTPNPAFRFFEWSGSDGKVRYYDKEKKEQVEINGKFAFLFLDSLSTVRGFNKQRKSGIYANEVKDVQTERLVVKYFKNNEPIATGTWSEIKEHVTSKSVGGGFAISVYMAVKDGGRLRIANFCMRGSALGAWIEFVKSAGDKLEKQAVVIAGSKEMTNGNVTFLAPVFKLLDCSEESHAEATALDRQLQEYLAKYRKAAPVVQNPEETPAPAPDPEPDEVPMQHPTDSPDTSVADEDIPF